MVQPYEVDIWFHFGSFAYGLESSLIECNRDSMLLQVVREEGNTGTDDLLSFLRYLIDNPKGLVRTELRLFTDNSTTETNHPICLCTDLSPSISPAKLENNAVLLRFFHAQGVTQEDSARWHKWIQNSAS